jgi:hypothetical protein
MVSVALCGRCVYVGALANNVQARSTPSLGTSPPPRTSAPPTDESSPVIVAEHMIGVAMYELVCDLYALAGGTTDKSRSVLVTTTS